MNGKGQSIASQEFVALRHRLSIFVLLLAVMGPGVDWIRSLDVTLARSIERALHTSALADVLLKAQSNGFPGATGSEASTINIALRGRAMRVINAVNGQVVLIDLERGDFREFSAWHKVYEKRPIASFQVHRDKREAERKKQVELVQSMTGAEREEALKSLTRRGIRLDGVINASTEVTSQTRAFEVVVDGRLRKLEAKLIKVRENEAIDPVFELWVSEDLELGADLLAFYQLGTFSEAVVKELGKVKGTALRINARLDSGSLNKQIYCELRAVETEALAAWNFDTPSRFKEVPDLAKFYDEEAQRRKEAESGALLCDDCGEAIKDKSTMQTWAPPGKRRFYFHDAKCRSRFIVEQKFEKNLEKKSP